MKILFVLSSSTMNAPNMVIYNIIKHIKELVPNIKIDVLVLSNHSSRSYLPLLKSLGIKVYEKKSLLDSIKDLCRNNTNYLSEYDIVHLNQFHAHIWGYFYSFFDKSVKLISTCHSDEKLEIKSHTYTFLQIIKSKLYYFLNQKLFYKKHKKVIAVSEAVNIYLHTFLEQDRTKLIYNGIDYSLFPPLHKKIYNSVIKFVQVGHINSLKNQGYTIHLLQYCKQKGLQVELHIVGKVWDESYFKELKIMIEKFQLNEDVHFYGEVNHKILFNLLEGMDIYVMPSKIEGFSIALLEAFYFGLPAIVSNRGGLPEAVEGGLDGMIVDIDSNKDFENVYNFLKEEKYITMGINARKKALKKFQAKDMATQYYELMKVLIEDKK